MYLKSCQGILMIMFTLSFCFIYKSTKNEKKLQSEGTKNDNTVNFGFSLPSKQEKLFLNI